MNIKSEFLLREIKKNIFSIFILFCTVLIGCTLNLILPQVISGYVDKVHANETNKVLSILACGYILLVCFSIGIKYLNIWFSEMIGWKISNNIRNGLLRHCVSLDINFHKSHTSGEMIERIDTDSSYVAEFFSVFIAGFLGNVILLFGIIVIFMFQNLGLGILYFFLSIVILSIFSIFQKAVTAKWNNARNKEVKVYGYINEHASGREDIKGIGSEIYTEKELRDIQNISKEAISNAAFFGNIPSTIFYSLLNLGETGSGKTSLLRALSSAYGEKYVSVTCQGNDVKLIPPNCCCVMQAPVLFSDTIKNNICMGRKFDEEKMKQVLEKVSFIKDLLKLEKGIFSVVGTGGTKLSGGQRKRIAIARALYRNPKILLLDDCMAGLDIVTSEEIYNKLIEKRDYTCIVATNDKRICENADVLINLNEGSIIYNDRRNLNILTT